MTHVSFELHDVVDKVAEREMRRWLGGREVVGRGVQFLLPRERGLAVRIVAPWEQRVRRAMHQRRCSERAAATYVRRTDRERSNFVRQYFHREVSNPALYDLVLDMGQTDLETAVDLVLVQCRARFPVHSASWQGT